MARVHIIAGTLLIFCIAHSVVAAKPSALGADITFSWIESDGSISETVAIAADRKHDGVLHLDHTQELKIKLKPVLSSGKTFEPEQSMVRFTSVASGVQASFGAAKSSDTEYLESKVEYSDLQDQMEGPSETFVVSLLLGNTQPAVAVERVLADITLHRPGADGSPAEAQPSGLSNIKQIKKEIVHTHRQPEKRTPAIISLAFTGVVAAPVVIFAMLAMQAWVNSKAPAATGMRFIAVCGFHGGIAAILLLQLIFWLRLNLLQALVPLLILETGTLVLGTVVFGIKAVPVVESRLKNE